MTVCPMKIIQMGKIEFVFHQTTELTGSVGTSEISTRPPSYTIKYTSHSQITKVIGCSHPNS